MRGPGLRFGVFKIRLTASPVLSRHSDGNRASGGGMTLLEAFKPGPGFSEAIPEWVLTGGTSGFQKS